MTDMNRTEKMKKTKRQTNVNMKKEEMKDLTGIDERALEFGLRIKQVRKILNLRQKEKDDVDRDIEIHKNE